MALIPNLAGRVFSVGKTSQHYFQSVMVLEDADQTYPNQKLEGPQRVYFTVPVEELVVSPGDWVSCFASPNLSDGTWEGEGLPYKQIPR